MTIIAIIAIIISIIYIINRKLPSCAGIGPGDNFRHTNKSLEKIIDAKPTLRVYTVSNIWIAFWPQHTESFKK